MQLSREIHTGRHCVFELYVHLVFIPKYRSSVFDKRSLEYMEDYFRIVCTEFESDLIEFNGEEDLVHCVIKYPSKIAVAALVNSLKGASSRKLRKYYPDMEKQYYKGVLWSPSYCAASDGNASDVVDEYKKNQRKPRA